MMIAFLKTFEESLIASTFVKATLSAYKGTDPALKNILIRKIELKGVPQLSFTYRNKTNDVVKNYLYDAALTRVATYLALPDFHQVILCTTVADFQYAFTANQKWKVSTHAATHLVVPAATHDVAKNRIITANNKPYLTALKITNAAGEVYSDAQDKYRQLNHFIEILRPAIEELPTFTKTHIVDMGSGKGYLTFALADYYQHVLKMPANIIGVEFRNDLVTLCNSIAQQTNCTNLQFVEGTIESFKPTELQILIALHACDTATDDAIAKGIKHHAALIVVAPCCHKQIRRAIEKSKQKNELDFITKHGIFLERESEMITDSIRAMILEYFGYQTKVFEFITDAHTPKNIMIMGVKKSIDTAQQSLLLEKIKQAKAFFGIESHYLETLLGI